MLYSNQPYKRVDDGIGSGLIAGAIIGGATQNLAAGMAFHKGMKVMAESGIDPRKRLDHVVNRYQRAIVHKKGDHQPFRTGLRAKQLGLNKIADESYNYLGDKKLDRAAKFAFGTGKRRNVSLGLSALAGSLIGAGIDASDKK